MVLRKKMHQVHSSKGADSAMNTVLVPTENNRWVLNHHSHHHQKMRPVSRPTLDPLDPLPVPSWTTWHPDNNNSSAATCWAHHSTASSKPYVNNSATLEDCCGATPGKTFLDLDEANNKEERDAEGTIIAGNVDPSSSSSAIMRWLEQKTPTEDQRMFAQGFQEAYQDVVKRERNPSTSTTPTTAGSACLVSSSDDTSPQSSRLMDDFGCREVPSSSSTQQSRTDTELIHTVVAADSNPMLSKEFLLNHAIVKREVEDFDNNEEEEDNDNDDDDDGEDDEEGADDRLRISTSRTLATGGKVYLGVQMDPTKNPLRLGHHRVRHHGGNNNNNNKRAVIDKRFNLNRGPLPLELLSEETAAKIEKKRERNRIAASKCRMKKLQRIAELEKLVEQLSTENEILRRAMGANGNLHQTLYSGSMNTSVSQTQNLQQVQPQGMLRSMMKSSEFNHSN